MYSFVSLCSLTALIFFQASLSSANESQVSVLEMQETDSAVFFLRSDFKDFISYAPKTETIVTCLDALDSEKPVHCSMTLKLKSQGEPSTSGMSAEFLKIYLSGAPWFYGVTAENECAITHQDQDSAVITAIKKASRHILKIKGNTLTNPKADICRFDFSISGTKEGREIVVTELKRQAKDGKLIQSPLSIVLNFRESVGDSLLQSLESFEIGTQEKILPTEAAFLIGLSTASNSDIWFRYNKAETETRRKYLFLALETLFDFDREKGRYNPKLPVNEKIYFEKSNRFSLCQR